jgi:hypothetical protein
MRAVICGIVMLLMVTAASGQFQLSPEQERRAAELRRQGAEINRREIDLILPGCKLDARILTTSTPLDVIAAKGCCA